MIRAELTRTNVLTRWPCHVCGGHTEMYSVLCEVPDSHPTHGGFRVCERCLKSRDFDAKLQERAAHLEATAAELRALQGQIEAPTFEGWQHACRLWDALTVLDRVEDEDRLDKSYPFDKSFADVTFAQAIAWPREQQDEVITRAAAAVAEEEAIARAEIAATGIDRRPPWWRDRSGATR